MLAIVRATLQRHALAVLCNLECCLATPPHACCTATPRDSTRSATAVPPAASHRRVAAAPALATLTDRRWATTRGCGCALPPLHDFALVCAQRCCLQHGLPLRPAAPACGRSANACCALQPRCCLAALVFLPAVVTIARRQLRVSVLAAPCRRSTAPPQPRRCAALCYPLGRVAQATGVCRLYLPADGVLSRRTASALQLAASR